MQYGGSMADSMNLNVRVGGSLQEHVVERLGDGSDYESVSEYIRDLIRKDRATVEQQAHERVKSELQLAFMKPDSDYSELSAADVISRNS